MLCRDHHRLRLQRRESGKNATRSSDLDRIANAEEGAKGKEGVRRGGRGEKDLTNLSVG